MAASVSGLFGLLFLLLGGIATDADRRAVLAVVAFVGHGTILGVDAEAGAGSGGGRGGGGCGFRGFAAGAGAQQQNEGGGGGQGQSAHVWFLDEGHTRYAPLPERQPLESRRMAMTLCWTARVRRH